MRQISPLLDLSEHAAEIIDEATKHIQQATDRIYSTCKEARDEINKAMKNATNKISSAIENIKGDIGKAKMNYTLLPCKWKLDARKQLPKQVQETHMLMPLTDNSP